jgi:hypothetical protein
MGADMRKASLLALLLVLAMGVSQAAAESAAAEAGVYAEIVFSEGGDLAILRSGGQLSTGEPIGLKLLPGDQIQTGSKTSVELVLMPRRSRLRLSENTAVTIRSMGSDGSTGLELVYGRLRSKVTKLASSASPYRVSSQAFVAGVRGTDFGCDVLASRPGLVAAPRVYCFEGSVEVEANPAADGAAKPEESKAEPVVLSAGSMAVIEAPAQGKEASVVQKPIDVETSTYWKANEFTSAMPSAVTALEASPAALPAPAFDLSPIRKGLIGKNAAGLASLAFFGAGAAFEGMSFLLRDSDAKLADTLLISGAICSAAGLPVLILSIAIDPLRGVKP